MGELRAYALAVAELRAVAGAAGERQERFRALARQAFAPGPLKVRDLLGPIHRRVPGGPVLRDDDPTPADLDALLAGTPVQPPRAAATWRLVEAVVAGLAWASTSLPGPDLPGDVLAPTGLAVPAVEGLTVGWCPVGGAAAISGLHDWLAGSDGWSKEAERAARPAPDVIGFWVR